MTEIFVLLGVLLSVIVFLIVKLVLKERRRPTDNFDGQQIEREHSAEARHVRAANTSIAVHNRFLDGGNDWRPRKR
ncbi:hypothetical protein OG322_27960 [Streptomyces sp. NBC_01260]|uniref:hypothetical protein n=1 Tax=unclassified Streptomyces TaxID=2593676 RepID=UPI000F46AC4D|nr:MULTISPECIES: hypothetical protein [unclassified Streptomyces]MCX4772997.1 hypothetical protein [Streptomyces sp. NBC_01285]ROQ71047.1 hypothetical protein EDD95_7138 [Streptomyces sp. CEV 2-1]RPK52149.1 hypothetical protein EES39_02425 [Streptomyces sp. ADI92-24]